MIDIIHIYSGTSGCAGSYLNEIYKALQGKYKQCVVVSCFYPYKYGKKVFYRFSDLSKKRLFHRINLLRLIFRYVELIFALIYSYLLILINKPSIVNYSLTSQTKVEKLFLSLIKKSTKCKLYLTVHDAVPFKNKYFNHNAYIEKRSSFYDLADILIVHNSNSIEDLKKHYGISDLKIVEFPFPVMDVTDLSFSQNDNLTSLLPKNKYIYSFIGHFRSEKGISVLLEAWNRFNSVFNKGGNFILVIAGNPSNYTNDFSNYENITVIDRFLNDYEYKQLALKSSCVVLPYTSGTNSGIPSTVIKLGTKVITSDIEMFINNEILDKRFMFKNKDVEDLVRVMNLATTIDYDDNLNKYETSFKNKVLSAFYQKN